MTRSSVSLPADALLFDLDGTLVDSTDVVVETWTAWAQRIGIDPEVVLAVTHGRRARDTVAALAPHADLDAEVDTLEAYELDRLAGVRLLPGANTVLATLRSTEWAVVTSGSRRLAEGRLRACGLPVPDVFVTADDVQAGKPDPQGYRLAAERLGARTDRCVVFEDAPAGVLAGHDAGATVVGLLTTHTRAELPAADVFVADLGAVTVERAGRLSVVATVDDGGETGNS